jgi:hypothetical protein
MRRKPLAKGRSYHYVLLIAIIFIGILVFYLSCKSKSPTEATSALNNQIAGQSMNNTTTSSSSTTTTIQANNPPTNTTTLITSRYLTSTSTSTSSTSSSTTTSRLSTTTTIVEPNLQWCSFTVYNSYWEYPKLITKKDPWTGTYEGAPMTLSNFVMKNMGSIPAENVVISIDKIEGDLTKISITQGNTAPGRIPNSGQCEKMQFKGNDSILLYIHGSAYPSEEWTVWLIESYSQTRFSFIIFVT